MDENEIDKASQRANLIERRMFQITLQSIDTLKHTTAIELHKSQNEMKKRLRKYRDRQREIVRSKPGFDKDPIEELITRQMRNRAKARQTTRPKTSTGCSRRITPKATEITPLKREGSSSSGVMTSPNPSPRLNGDKFRLIGDSSSESSDHESDDLELDGSFMIDQQKSKIDLRPKTAVDIVRRGQSLDKYVNIGRLGPAVKQVRYFDEDELNDRGHFYRHLVEKRINEEKTKLNSLDDKVAEFCGNETIQTMTRKIQAKRKLFTNNSPEWSNTANTKQRSKSSHGFIRKQSESQSSKGISDRKNIIRPSTSVGFRKSSGMQKLNSFRKPSYITT